MPAVMAVGGLYAALSAELALIVAASTAVSYYWRHGCQHATLRLVATPSFAARPWAAQRAGAACLLAFRASCATVWITVMVSAAQEGDSRIYLFFTTWNYLLQATYFVLSAVAGARLLWKPHWALLETRAERALARAVWALFSVCLPSSVMVTVVLWGVLLPATLRSGSSAAIDAMLSASSFAQHLVNTILLMLDFAVNHMLVDTSTLVLVVCWNVAYVLFEWVAHSMSAKWTYFFRARRTQLPAA